MKMIIVSLCIGLGMVISVPATPAINFSNSSPMSAPYLPISYNVSAPSNNLPMTEAQSDIRAEQLKQFLFKAMKDNFRKKMARFSLSSSTFESNSGRK